MLKLRRALMAGAALAVVADAAAYAQEQGIETVVVTGSRIPRAALDSPNPMISLTSQDISNSGTTNITSFLQRIPSLLGSIGDLQTSGLNTSQTDAGSSLSGLNLLDLRNLGFDRTLVLEDGQRLVSSSTGNAAVDINTIPITLIERVDVVTGGSSAVYGADGVSGAVNFIMKKDLDGITARAQAGASQDGGGNKYLGAVSIGHNFDDDKGNVTLTFEYSYQDRLNFQQRDSTKIGGATFAVPNPDNPTGSISTLPKTIMVKNGVIYFVSATGATDVNLDLVPDFNGNGTVFDNGQPNAIGLGGEFGIGGDALPLAAAFNADLMPLEHRNIAEISGHEDFSRYFHLSGEFRFAHVDTASNSEPSFNLGATVASDDPFLQPNVANAIATNGTDGIGGIAGVGYGFVGSYPYLTPALVLGEKVSRNIYRGVLNLAGDLPLPEALHDASYHISYVYGQSDITDTVTNNLIEDRYYAALDAVTDPSTGQAVCRSNLNGGQVPVSLFGDVFDAIVGLPTSMWGTSFTPGANSGCVAYNPFVANSAQNKTATAWMTRNTSTSGLLRQQDLNGYISFDMPQIQDWGAAGPLSFVFGGEWRDEVSQSISDPLTRQLQIPGQPPGNTISDYFSSGSPVVSGRFQVSEAFSEVTLPLIANKTLVNELTFHAAGRISNYSTAGTNNTWELDSVYSPIEGLKLRGTLASATRAPNIGELFAPLVLGFQGINDPCDPIYIGNGTSFRAANCQAIEDSLLGPGNYTAGTTPVQQSVTLPTFIGGNSHLKPEVARTLTLGTVLQPDFLPNFVATVDWYRVKIDGAIASLGAQTIADQCVDLSTIANPFCAAITRNGIGTPIPGSIKQLVAQEINVSEFSTEGIDFSANYHTDLDDMIDDGGHYGGLDLHLIGNHLMKFSSTELAGEAPVNGINTTTGGVDGGPTPYWQLNLDAVWNMDKWTVDYNVDWYNGLLTISRQTFISQPNDVPPQYLHAPDHDVQSIQVAYDLQPGWNVYAGITNLWYQKPAANESFNGIPADPLGRVFYAGVRLDLGPQF